MLKVACSGPGVSRTRNLSVTSPIRILYHYTTAPTVKSLKIIRISSFEQGLCKFLLVFHCNYTTTELLVKLTAICHFTLASGPLNFRTKIIKNSRLY